MTRTFHIYNEHSLRVLDGVLSDQYVDGVEFYVDPNTEDTIIEFFHDEEGQDVTQCVVTEKLDAKQLQHLIGSVFGHLHKPQPKAA